LSDKSADLMVFATRNNHKIKELKEMVHILDVHLVPLRQIAPNAPDVAETGSDFLENAAIKAISAYIATGGAMAVSDDSGICVDHLDGGPGIHSARFAGDDEANNDRLLAELQGVDNRAAHYYCALALVCSRDALTTDLPQAGVHLEWPGLPRGAVLVETRGEVHGTITHERRGTGGFGYDPLFYLDELQCTFAQCSAEQKHRISHRGKAFASLVSFLEAYRAL
jgi:XTP/dITP diphosphohydrolase